MDAHTTVASEPTPAQSSRSETFGFQFYLVCFAVAVALYVLSPGPIAKCARAAYGPTLSPSTARVAAIAYAPIVFCCQRFPALEHFYNWYMKDVWGLP